MRVRGACVGVRVHLVIKFAKYAVFLVLALIKPFFKNLFHYFKCMPPHQRSTLQLASSANYATYFSIGLLLTSSSRNFSLLPLSSHSLGRSLSTLTLTQASITRLSVTSVKLPMEGSVSCAAQKTGKGKVFA